VVERRGATAVVDADGGYGFRPSLMAAGLASEIASSLGAGVVGVRNSHHFGMAALYSMRISTAGMIGIVTTTSSPVLAPPGGTRPVVGNNPISCAVPRKAPNPPIVLDMALSEVAFGRIRIAAAEGRSIPEGWAYDASGWPTTDAAEALRAGMLAPVGRHKGYGLSVIAEVLAGVLTMSPFGTDSDAHGRQAGGVGHLVLAINPGHFLEPVSFYEGVESLVAQIRAVPCAADGAGVFLPGEPELNVEAVRRRDGIPVTDELAQRLDVLAQDVGVASVAWRVE
jgi:LDH2 family malate/lactate/ureidoglycolate dehydrogenase